MNASVLTLFIREKFYTENISGSMKRMLIYTVLLGLTLLKQSCAKPLDYNDVLVDEDDGGSQSDLDVEKRIVPLDTKFDELFDTILCIFTFRNC